MTEFRTVTWRQHRKRVAKTALSLIALSVATWYIAMTLRDGLEQIVSLGVSTSIEASAALLGGVVLTLILSAIYHVHTLDRIEPVVGARLRIANAYSLGQIVRYVPGKVVGLLFQASYLSGYVKASSVALALIVQTAYDNAWTIVFAIVLLALSNGETNVALALFVGGTALAYLSHRHAVLERLLLLPGFVRRRVGHDELQRISAVHPSLFATAALACVWFPMCLALWIFLREIATPQEIAALGACYLLASVGSMLVFVVPSGIVVREAVLLFIGSHLGLDESLLIYSAVALRLALTAGEVACAASLSAAMAWARRSAGQGPLSR